MNNTACVFPYQSTLDNTNYFSSTLGLMTYFNTNKLVLLGRLLIVLMAIKSIRMKLLKSKQELDVEHELEKKNNQICKAALLSMAGELTISFDGDENPNLEDS